MSLTAVLARWRVSLGFVFAVVVLWMARPTGTSLVLGAAIACIGEAVRVWAAGHLEKSREVTKSGPYRFTRHPLYVGSSIMGLGLAVAANSIPAAVLIVAYLLTTVWAAIRNEEAFLRQQFGEEYDAYAAGAARDTARRFSVERARRNREYRALVGLSIVMLVLVAKAAWLGGW